MVAVLALALAVLADRSGLLLHRGDDRARYDGRTFDVVEVLAGDLLDVEVADADRPVTRVRLWGVNAPQPARAGHPPLEAEPWGDEAQAWVRRRVAGERVRLEVEPHRLRDRSGHLLAHVYLVGADMSLNAQLLQAGLARTDARWSHEHLDDYAQQEADARAAGRGLWADTAR